MRLVGFQFGPSMLVLENYPDRPRGIHHVCVSVKSYTIASATSILKSSGIEVVDFGDGPELLYFRDPDGTLIQLYAPGYRSPNWRRVRGTPTVPMFKAAGIDHVTLQVSNLERSTASYERLFGHADSFTNGASILTRKGDLSWITYGVNPIGIDHFCVSAAGYEGGLFPKAIAERLASAGIRPEAVYEPGQAFLRDPDGILVQLAGRG
jgi:catechol 2,3-dioxygenase-like lactoylglutathione lyase family enzyme